MTIPADMRVSLKMAREIKGLKLKEAAKLIGRTPDTLRRYEKGLSYPDIPTLKAIEKAYSISYNQIIFLPLDIGLTDEEAE